jgi:Tol biopolymer transport system component/DNA-binding winged helix-turn-helix (wHTH) protein
MSNELNKLYEFGGFRFNPRALTLWRGERLIQLPPKALELLKLLVERRGEIVSKQEIFDSIWAGTFVEEGVLTQNIYTLRKALGTDENGRQLIENVARRGYRLTVPARVLSGQIEPVTTTIPTTQGEILLAALERRTEIVTEEIIEDDTPPKLAAGKKPFYRRKTYVLFAGGLIFAALAGIFLLYLFPPRRLASLFKPPAAEMHFQRLTDTGDVAYLVISPDGEFVAFNRGREVFLKDLRSGGEVKLNLGQSGKTGCLQFSPDSARLFFGNISEPNAAGKIFQISRFGGAVAKPIAENVWSGFSLSPDGRTIAFHRKFPDENRWVLILKNLETGAERELAPRLAPEEYYWNNYPAWSADGKKIAAVVTSRTEHFLRLLIIDAESGREEEAKTRKFRNVEQIVWAADGESFLAAANDGENFQLWRIEYPSGEASRITNDLNSYLGLSITKDGRKLLARQRIYYSNIWVGNQTNLENLRQLTVGTSRNDGLKGLAWLGSERIVYASNNEKLRDWNLWTVDAADGNSRRQITFDAETQNEEPATAPDGQTVYFSSNRATTAHVWRVQAGGENLAQITFDEAAATELYPQISPDGAWLYYIRKAANSSAVWRKSLIDGRAEKLTDERKFSPGTFLSLSPDGRFIAFQNLSAKEPGGEQAEYLKVAVIGVENPSDAKFFRLPPTRQFVKWQTGDAFDYVVETTEGAQIWRQPLDETAAPVLILNLPKDDIFNFAWSKDGQHLAVARGQLLRDAVLLTASGR